METLELTWERVVKVWWSLVWRGTVFGMLGGFVIGFVIGLVGAASGVNQSTVNFASTLSGMGIAIPIGIVVVRSVLRKRFSDFRLLVVPLGRAESGNS